MDKLTTEKQAWLATAKKCDKPTRDNDGDYCIQNLPFLDAWDAYGICMAVDNLATYCLISSDTEDKMLEKLRKHLPKKRYRLSRGQDVEFCWPNTLKGWKARAAFCRRMAKLCEKEKNNG